MKEIKFNGYVRSYGVRATGSDLHIINDLYAQLDERPCECEVTIRIRDKRQEWIDHYYNLAKRMANAGTYVIKHCKEVCYVIPSQYAGAAAASTPRHGDKYDYKTGVAVAFAKAFGDRVPDYI